MISVVGIFEQGSRENAQYAAPLATNSTIENMAFLLDDRVFGVQLHCAHPPPC